MGRLAGNFAKALDKGDAAVIDAADLLGAKADARRAKAAGKRKPE
jgi:hypothetical protein